MQGLILRIRLKIMAWSILRPRRHPNLIFKSYWWRFAISHDNLDLDTIYPPPGTVFWRKILRRIWWRVK